MAYTPIDHEFYAFKGGSNGDLRMMYVPAVVHVKWTFSNGNFTLLKGCRSREFALSDGFIGV